MEVSADFKIALIGKQPFAADVLKRFQEKGFTVVAVSAPEPKEGEKADPLWQAASDAGLPLVDTESLKGEDAQAKWKAFDADLCVMAFVTVFLPEKIFDFPKHGTIQYHPSILPLHRGISAISWAVINQEAKTGLTIFYPDHDLDTGPILMTKEVDISPDDTVVSLYFKKLYPLGVDALEESVRLVANGNAPKIEQDHSLATYEPPCRAVHGAIQWYRKAPEIYAQIRGCNPQPGAHFTHDGNKIKVFNCALDTKQVEGMYGTVLSVDDTGIAVRLNGGVLKIQRVQAPGEAKRPAHEWAADAGVKAGTRFKNGKYA